LLYRLDRLFHLLFLVWLCIISFTATDRHCSGVSRVHKLAMRSFTTTVNRIKARPIQIGNQFANLSWHPKV
jgi:hypothetical protein